MSASETTGPATGVHVSPVSRTLAQSKDEPLLRLSVTMTHAQAGALCDAIWIAADRGPVDPAVDEIARELSKVVIP